MRKSKLMKIFLVGILSLMLVFVATQVLADDDGFTDLTGSISNTANTTNEGTNSVNDISNSTANDTVNNTANSTLNDLNTTNSSSNISSSYNNTTTNMSSSYNNTNLPSTGLGDTTSMMFIIVVLAISAIYAYKKVSDYRNL